MKEETQCGINKTWYYSARKKNVFVRLAELWKELESMVLSEMSDHKDKYRYSLTFKIQMEKDMNIEGRGDSWVFGNHRGRRDMINMYENVIMKTYTVCNKTILK